MRRTKEIKIHQVILYHLTKLSWRNAFLFVFVCYKDIVILWRTEMWYKDFMFILSHFSSFKCYKVDKWMCWEVERYVWAQMIKYRMRMWKSSFKNKQKRWEKKNICNKKLHGFQSIHPADDSDDYEPFLQNAFLKIRCWML